MRAFFKNTFKSKLSKIMFILLLAGLLFTIVSMIFPMLFVKESITSMNVWYRQQLDYEWRFEYRQECGFQYQWFLGQYQPVYVCRYVPYNHLVPVWRTVPQYQYITTYFNNDAYLFDMILSSFALGTKQLYFVIPLLLILFGGSSLVFLNKSIFKKIGYICLGALTIIFTGSVFGVLRLFLTNLNSSTLAVSFYLMIINMGIFISLIVLSYIKKSKDTTNEENKSLIVKNTLKTSLLIRFVIFLTLVLISEICVTTIYGFVLYIIFLSGLVLSYSDKLWSKILMLVGASGLFIYSIITMTLVLVDLDSISHFFDALPVDRLLMHIINLGVLITTIVMFIKEVKKLKCLKQSR
ncbi:MAG: hypothetical protein J1F31_00205 [Erysipelotrichales bacterium]|nr:hypothetical protein [Erysipelotrichales bacterium]